MPITGPLRAVDTKVLGIDLETTRLYGSALDRYVLVALDTGFGTPTATVDFIRAEKGTVEVVTASESADADLASVALERRSLDGLILYGGTLDQSGAAAVSERVSETIAAAGDAVRELAVHGGSLTIRIDLHHSGGSNR